MIFLKDDPSVYHISMVPHSRQSFLTKQKFTIEVDHLTTFDIRIYTLTHKMKVKQGSLSNLTFFFFSFNLLSHLLYKAEQQENKDSAQKSKSIKTRSFSFFICGLLVLPNLLLARTVTYTVIRILMIYSFVL